MSKNPCPKPVVSSFLEDFLAAFGGLLQRLQSRVLHVEIPMFVLESSLSCELCNEISVTHNPHYPGIINEP